MILSGVGSFKNVEGVRLKERNKVVDNKLSGTRKIDVIMVSANKRLIRGSTRIWNSKRNI